MIFSSACLCLFLSRSLARCCALCHAAPRKPADTQTFRLICISGATSTTVRFLLRTPHRAGGCAVGIRRVRTRDIIEISKIIIMGLSGFDSLYARARMGSDRDFRSYILRSHTRAHSISEVQTRADPHTNRLHAGSQITAHTQHTHNRITARNRGTRDTAEKRCALSILL